MLEALGGGGDAARAHLGDAAHVALPIRHRVLEAVAAHRVVVRYQVDRSVLVVVLKSRVRAWNTDLRRVRIVFVVTMLCGLCSSRM